MTEERKMFGQRVVHLRKLKFEIAAAMETEGAAIVIIHEPGSNGTNGTKVGLEPVFLILQDGSWKICAKKDDLSKIDPSKGKALEKLEMFLGGFKFGAAWQRSQTAG